MDNSHDRSWELSIIGKASLGFCDHAPILRRLMSLLPLSLMVRRSIGTTLNSLTALHGTQRAVDNVVGNLDLAIRKGGGIVDEWQKH